MAVVATIMVIMATTTEQSGNGLKHREYRYESAVTEGDQEGRKVVQDCNRNGRPRNRW